jgi:hypothetical protein
MSSTLHNQQPCTMRAFHSVDSYLYNCGSVRNSGDGAVENYQWDVTDMASKITIKCCRFLAAEFVGLQVGLGQKIVVLPLNQRDVRACFQ